MRGLKIASLWIAVVGLTALLYQGASVEYHRYENEAGIGRDWIEYVGPSLEEELPGGEDYIYQESVRSLDKQPELRTLLVIALGWLAIVQNVRWWD